MSQFRTILVPVNGTAQDHVTIPMALDEVFRHEASLVFLYVVGRPEPCDRHLYGGGPQPSPGFADDSDTCAECQEAWAYLNHLQKKYHTLGFAEQIVRVGDTVHQVEIEAKKHGRTLVVMPLDPELSDAKDNHLHRLERLLRHGSCELLLVGRAPAAPVLFDGELCEH